MQQYSIFNYNSNEIRVDSDIRLIELFAGYGSQALALERIGADFTTWKMCEFDKYAVKSYNAIHGTNYEPSDIRDLKGEDLEIVDTDKHTYLLTYSFPCTDLSNAGKMLGMKKGSGTRSGLLWEVERLLKECYEKDGRKGLPQILFMENVPQVIAKKNEEDFADWTNFLESLGYKSTYEILNAADFGVPQSRKRCFMFSFLGDFTYNFPEEIELDTIFSDKLEDVVDDRHYLKTEKSREVIKELILNGRVIEEIENGQRVCINENMEDSVGDR